MSGTRTFTNVLTGRHGCYRSKAQKLQKYSVLPLQLKCDDGGTLSGIVWKRWPRRPTPKLPAVEIANVLKSARGLCLSNLFSPSPIYLILSRFFPESVLLIACALHNSTLPSCFDSCLPRPSREGHSLTNCRSSVCCCCPSAFWGHIASCTALDCISSKQHLRMALMFT